MAIGIRRMSLTEHESLLAHLVKNSKPNLSTFKACALSSLNPVFKEFYLWLRHLVLGKRSLNRISKCLFNE